MTFDGTVTKILVPTDFSSGSRRAWAMARRLAGTLGAELTLVHVLPAAPVEMLARYALEEARAAERSRQAEHQLGITRDEADDLPPLPRAYRGPFVGDGVCSFSPAGREWAMKLEEWAAAATNDGCKVVTVLRVGDPHREIIDTANDEHCDLIVMATHGRGEVHRLLVGSVADKVIRMSSCPVMTLKAA